MCIYGFYGFILKPVILAIGLRIAIPESVELGIRVMYLSYLALQSNLYVSNACSDNADAVPPPLRQNFMLDLDIFSGYHLPCLRARWTVILPILLGAVLEGTARIGTASLGVQQVFSAKSYESSSLNSDQATSSVRHPSCSNAAEQARARHLPGKKGRICVLLQKEFFSTNQSGLIHKGASTETAGVKTPICSLETRTNICAS